MDDLFGKALLDYHKNKTTSPLLLHNKFSDPDILDLDGYFFDEKDFSDLEHYALSLCRGKVLDIGAAAGRHCLYLQQNSLPVTGLDISKNCCELMRLRGIHSIACSSVFDYSQKADTMIMLMNGIGWVGNIPGLERFLTYATTILTKKGQIIFDSSDISHLKSNYQLPKKSYFGEIDYQFEYQGIKGDWFTWLYIDPQKLERIARKHGWLSQVIFHEEEGQFLARLVRS